MDNKKDIIEQLRAFSTPELCDGAGDYRTMDYHISEQVTDKKIVGTAYTIRTPYGVNGLVPDAILAASAGDILVIAGQGCCEKSYWGDYRSILASMKGLEGIIVDGAYRDKEACEEVGLPVFARNVVCGSGNKAMEGEMNVTVECGGVTVEPGDYIVADQNGIIVMKPSEVMNIIEEARKKIEAEKRVMEYMRQTGEVIPRVGQFSKHLEVKRNA